MITGMGLMMVLGLLLLVVAVGGAVYLGVRAAQPRAEKQPTARENLQQRLAAGQITPEEYFERESALRDSEPPARGRR